MNRAQRRAQEARERRERIVPGDLGSIFRAVHEVAHQLAREGHLTDPKAFAMAAMKAGIHEAIEAGFTDDELAEFIPAAIAGCRTTPRRDT